MSKGGIHYIEYILSRTSTSSPRGFLLWPSDGPCCSTRGRLSERPAASCFLTLPEISDRMLPVIQY